jgi:glycosyltransferase involved in cell wall biosynthesis
MKKFIKKFIPSDLWDIFRFVHKKFKKTIKNYFNTNFRENVLISYITYPFKNGVNLGHTNNAEVFEIAKVFKELGYNIDIVDYDYESNLDYDKYSIIFGFGEPLEKSFYNKNHKILTIFYGTGMYDIHNNHATLKRIEEVYKKKGKLLLESGRIIDKAWSAQTSLVDSIITLGNDEVVNSYKQYFSREIYNIPVSYYKIFDSEQILKNKSFIDAKNHFLWFGSSGLIHKGLDLLLEVFKELPDLHLHICGPINNEPRFKAVYYEELYNTKNIHTYGFINIQSKSFKDIIDKCAFVIFPSCSEGEPSSVINVMVYGLIPIVTNTAGIRIKDFGIEIKELTNTSVKESIIKAVNLSKDEIEKRSMKCANDTINNHSIEKYSHELKKALIEILREKNEM